MIEYRSASEPVDLDQLARLFDSVGWQHRTRDRDRLSRMVAGSMYGALANDGETLVGYARAISDGAFNAYVSTVAVLPDYQRRGIGRELVRRVLEGRDHSQFVLHAAPRGAPLLPTVRRSRRLLPICFVAIACIERTLGNLDRQAHCAFSRTIVARRKSRTSGPHGGSALPLQKV